MSVQLFTGVKDNKGRMVSLQTALQKIPGKELQSLELGSLYNKYLQEKDEQKKESFKTAYDQRKSKLPAVTWSGIFAEATVIKGTENKTAFLEGKLTWSEIGRQQAKRYVRSRAEEQLIQHSGIICLDIDKLTPAEVKKLQKKITADLHTYACFVSPSGCGLKVLVKIPADEKQHKNIFRSLEKYFAETFGAKIDPSGKDVTRLCFLCHDPAFYFNENSCLYQPKIRPEKKQVQEKKRSVAAANLYGVIAFTDRVATYEPGNHNNYIHLFACNANRKGFSLDETLAFSVSHFSNKDAEEVKRTVRSAYEHNTTEHGQSKQAAGLTDTKKEKSNLPKLIKIDGKDFKPFWRKYKFTKGKGEDAYEVERMELSRVDFSDFLFEQGFHLLNTGKSGYQICYSRDGIVKPVDPQEIKQFVLKWCREHGLREVEEMLRRGQKQYFAYNELDSLPYKEIKFRKDTKKESYFYFRNCWVKVTADKIACYEYSSLKEYVWEANKIDADFTRELSPFAAGDNEPVDLKMMECEFAKFIYLFAYNPECPEERKFSADLKNKRFWSIATAYGFLLDGYKHPALRKGIFAVDHKIGDKNEQNGRTGKSIIPKAAGHLKKVSTINGKSFNPSYQFKYEPITLDSQIINFNDMPKNFDVEVLFEIIADDYTVIRRNNGYVEFPYTESPKPYISTNFVPKGDGASYTGRMHVIEASDYFSDKRSPFDLFGHALFTDWTQKQWNLFYNTSMQCVQAYKALGLLPYPAGNFNMRKLINEVLPEFIDFMDDPETVPRNTRLNKEDLMGKFNERFYMPVYGRKMTPHTFKKWVKSYCSTKGLRLNPHKSDENDGRDRYKNDEFYTLADDNWNGKPIEL